jgi:hypothetical protein
MTGRTHASGNESAVKPATTFMTMSTAINQ